MSTWIKVTNLPYYYDEKEAMDMFEDIGSIKRVHIEHIQALLKSNAFIQFVNPRHARLAATKKDEIVFADAVIRVRVIWSRDESLTTVQVSNLPADINERELHDFFAPYGEIVDIDFNKEPLASETEKTNLRVLDKEMMAWISFSRVDYALRACQEMHHSIISGSSDDSGLCVKLVNPDSRNLKWKRNQFEYVRCPLPSERTKTSNPNSHKNVNHKGWKSKTIDPKSCAPSKSPSLSSGSNPKIVENNHGGINDTSSRKFYPQMLNVSSPSLNNSTNSAVNWLPSSIYTGSASVNGNTGAVNMPSSLSGTNVAVDSNIGTVPYSANLNNVNTFNAVPANLSGNFPGVVPLLSPYCWVNSNTTGDAGSGSNMANVCLLQSNTQHVQASPGIFAQQDNPSTPNSVSSTSVRNENIASHINLTAGSNVHSGGNVKSSTLLNPISPSNYGTLLLPNAGGNSNMFLMVPQTGGFFTSMPSCSNTTSISSYDVSQTTPFLSTLHTPHSSTGNSNININNVSHSNLIPSVLPSCENMKFIVTKSDPTPSVVSGTTVSNQSASNASVSSSVSWNGNNNTKIMAIDPSNSTTPKKASSTKSVSSSSDVSSSSAWSRKQREMGDIIYRQLKQEFPSRVAKLTGMLLSLPEEELNRLLVDSYKLKARAHQFCQLLDSNESL